MLIGYVLFAGLSVALFALSHRDPHATQEGVFIAFSLVYGAVSALLAGYLAGVIGGGNPVRHARTLALAIAAVAIVSLLARPGAGSPWSQIAALALFAPLALVGGWLRAHHRGTAGHTR